MQCCFDSICRHKQMSFINQCLKQQDFSILCHQEKREKLVRMSHLLAHNLRIICNLIVLISFPVSFILFKSRIYPFIWHSLITSMCQTLCEELKMGRWVRCSPCWQEGKERLPSPLQGNGFAYALAGAPSCLLRDRALSSGSPAHASASNSSHSA